MRVLVVEDEAALAQQLAEALQQAGYVVDHAADGERADFLGHTEQYDAVVLDLGLPRMDGLTVLRRWRDAGIAVPVIVLTARGSWHEKVQGSIVAPMTTCRSRSAWKNDDGPGIDAGMRQKVLQRGVRADETSIGSGLGLAIVRDLVEPYDGSIALDESPSGGLRARLALPAC